MKSCALYSCWVKSFPHIYQDYANACTNDTDNVNMFASIKQAEDVIMLAIIR